MFGIEAGYLVGNNKTAPAMHEQFTWEGKRNTSMVSTGNGDDLRPRKRRKLARAPPSSHSNGVNGINHEGSLEKSKRELPIFSGKQAILDAFRTHDTIVILGEPGSGKTTRSSFTLAKCFLFLRTLDPCRSTSIPIGIIPYSQQPKNRCYTTTANLSDIHRPTGRRRAVLQPWKSSRLLCTL